MVLLQEKAVLTTVSKWMSWEGGVDLVAKTDASLDQPNIILHVARQVHTPVGSAPAGMVLYQPNPNEAPAVFGFVCNDPQVGAYFSPNIFAGTPFENAPVLQAKIEIKTNGVKASSRIEVAGLVFETQLQFTPESQLISREPGNLPFYQQGLEHPAQAQLSVNGQPIEIVLPEASIGGGPAAVYCPSGCYAR